MESLLITGGSGFIGSSFINKYRAKYDIHIFSLQDTLITQLKLEQIETIVHCAALVHQKRKQSYTKYYEINTEYPVELAKKAKASGVKQFLLMSTIAVYDEELEKVNEMSICNPMTSYGKSKYEAEKKLMELENQNFKVSIIRPTIVYGRYAPGNFQFLIKLVEWLPVIPLGNIKNRRSFIYIDNLLYTMDRVISHKKSGIFLARDNDTLSISKVLELIAKNANKKVRLIKIPFLENITKMLFPSLYRKIFISLEVDDSKTKKVLSITNSYNTEYGIRKTLRDK